MTAKEFLKKYNESQGWGTSDDELVETLYYGSGKCVWKGDQDKHRWYISETRVQEFDGTFIEHIDYVITGDNSVSDMGIDLKEELDRARIVERKERVETVVYYE